MISSANWWAIWRAVSSLAVAGVLLGEDLGELGVLGVVEKAVDDERCRSATPMLPKATKAALAGAGDHWARFISAGVPGVAAGARLLETMSKMPAVGEVGVEDGVEGVLVARSRVGGRGLEVGGGDADAAGAGGWFRGGR